MTAFADMIEADIPAVFLNVEEYGVARSIDGAYAVKTVLESEEFDPHNVEGAYLSTSVLHIAKSDLPAVPVISQRMDIDGKIANVVKVDEAMGMLSIHLQWFES